MKIKIKMNKFWRQNGIMIAAIALPIVISLFFIVKIQIQKNFVEEPKYSVLLEVQDYYNKHYKFTVRGNEVVLEYYPLVGGQLANSNEISQKPYLLLVNPMDKSVTEVSLPDIPEGRENERHNMPIKELGDVKLSTNITSPDGYTFNSYRQETSLATDIVTGFGGNYGKYDVILKNGARTIHVPIKNNTKYYYRPNLVAWIMKENKN